MRASEIRRLVTFPGRAPSANSGAYCEPPIHDAWAFAYRASACLAEAISMSAKVIAIGDDGERHALLELRKEMEAAGPELSVAATAYR